MRKSRVLSISLPPKIDDQLEAVAKSKHQSKSEVVKNLLLAIDEAHSQVEQSGGIKGDEIESLLAKLYQVSRKQKKEIIVVGVGLIDKDRKVLIGKREGKDSNIRHLTWSFPGGRMRSMEFEDELKRIIQAETNLKIEVGDLIHTRIHPDNINPDVKLVVLYFDCSVVDDAGEKPGGYKKSAPMVELKWVKPMDVVKYFTASTADEVMTYLRSVELG